MGLDVNKLLKINEQSKNVASKHEIIINKIKEEVNYLLEDKENDIQDALEDAIREHNTKMTMYFIEQPYKYRSIQLKIGYILVKFPVFKCEYEENLTFDINDIDIIFFQICKYFKEQRIILWSSTSLDKNVNNDEIDYNQIYIFKIRTKEDDLADSYDFL